MLYRRGYLTSDPAESSFPERVTPERVTRLPRRRTSCPAPVRYAGVVHRWVAAALVVSLLACRQPKPSDTSSAGPRPSAVTPAVDASAPDATAKTVDAGIDAAGPRLPRPLLVAALDRGLAAVLLSTEAPKSPSGARRVLLSREPIATAGVDLPESAWNDETRVAVAEKYKLGGPGAKGDCVGAFDRVVDLSRIVAGDPTMSEKRLPDDELASEAFDKGAHAVAAIVRLSGSCKGSRWAVPGDMPAPSRLALTPLDARAAARYESILVATSESYGSLPQTPDWKRSFKATRLGPRLVWAVAMRTQPGVPLMLCALFDAKVEPPKVLAETSTCPEAVEAATEDEGGVVVWFAHAFARLEGADFEKTYFPTAAFAPYGAP